MVWAEILWACLIPVTAEALNYYSFYVHNVKWLKMKLFFIKAPVYQHT